VTLSSPPRITGRPAVGVNPPPPPPPPRPPVRTTPPQTPPVPQPPPQNPQPVAGDQPVQVDPTQGVHVDPRIVGPEPQPIPEDDPEGTYAEGNDEPPVPQPIPNEGNTTSDQPSANQNEPTPEQTPAATKYADMGGEWVMERWTDHANFTVSQNGNRVQATHDYPWSSGTRHSEAVGTIEDQPCKGARIGRVDMDFTYNEPDGRVTHASYTGEVTCDENGKAVRISWDNGSNWKRP